MPVASAPARAAARASCDLVTPQILILVRVMSLILSLGDAGVIGTLIKPGEIDETPD